MSSAYRPRSSSKPNTLTAAWTGEIHADISVALTSYKEIDPTTGDKIKRREVFVAVRHDRRLDSAGADSLFEAIVKEIETTDVIKVRLMPGVNEESELMRGTGHALATRGC